LEGLPVKELLKYTQKPVLYEPGNAFMWTDPYVAKQLLEVHLSDETDLASRKTKTRNTTIDWILSNSGADRLKILDLGCGPGLYAEELALRGHAVTGIDISANSIDYAKSQAQNKKLDINYLCQDYTRLMSTDGQYDLVILVYADFCPLLPDQRGNLLNGVKNALKPGGLFIFDFTNDANLENKLSPKNWEISQKGFWQEQPYIALSNSYFYEEEKVVLYQHVIVDEEHVQVYRFWHHFFSNSDIGKILGKHGFREVSFHKNIIPGGDGYESEDITFCIANNTTDL
jgi:SAM-dependent methyltransferase